MTNEEYFDLIEGQSQRIIGKAPRRECHGNPSLLHRSIRVVIWHPDGGKILLQKRAMTKDIFPGRWDMAVGGHVDSGEDLLSAAYREMREELGLEADLPLQEAYKIPVRNQMESEDVQAYQTVSDGPFRIREEELSSVRFFTLDELRFLSGSSPEMFTPLLLRELKKILPEADCGEF